MDPPPLGISSTDGLSPCGPLRLAHLVGVDLLGQPVQQRECTRDAAERPVGVLEVGHDRLGVADDVVDHAVHLAEAVGDAVEQLRHPGQVEGQGAHHQRHDRECRQDDRAHRRYPLPAASAATSPRVRNRWWLRPSFKMSSVPLATAPMRGLWAVFPAVAASVSCTPITPRSMSLTSVIKSWSSEAATAVTTTPMPMATHQNVVCSCEKCSMSNAHPSNTCRVRCRFWV